MKLTTNHTIKAPFSHISYYNCMESFTFYTADDEEVELIGIELDEVICFARNFVVVDLVKNIKRSELHDHQIKQLREIKDAISDYLTSDEEDKA